MRYNKWKEANDYWRMVINKPFKVRGRNVMLLNYLANYDIRQNKSSYVTKIMHRFTNYLNKICEEIFSCIARLDEDKYFLLCRNDYVKDLICINPYISITREQIHAIDNFIDTYRCYTRAFYNRHRLRKSIISNLLDAIDEISSIQDVLRQHKYNKTHKRKHPYPIVDGNFFERDSSLHTQYYDNYKQRYLDCLRQNIDITKTFYKCNPALDPCHIFNKVKLRNGHYYNVH